MWPFDTRLRAELDAVKADRERIRGERNQFLKDRKSAQAAAKTAAQQFTKADEALAAVSKVNACLTEEHEAHRQAIAVAVGYGDPHVSWGRLAALIARITASRDTWQTDHKVQKDRADLAEARLKDAARETDRLNAELAEAREEGGDKSVAHWSAQARREKKRADRLQKQYDDAVGLKPGGIEDSRKWQPGYVDPKAAQA